MKNWVISLIVISCIGLYAQDPYSITIDKSKGLPSNAVYDVFQDSKGFMWFATDEGLCRYDGKVFKTYTSPILTSRSGTCINEDKYGRIWYMNFDNRVYCIENDTTKGLIQNINSGLFLKYHILGDYILVPQVKGIDVFTLHDLQYKKTLPFAEIIYTTGTPYFFFLQDEFGDVYRIDRSLKYIRVCWSKMLIISANNDMAVMCDKLNNTQTIDLCNGTQSEQSPFPFAENITNISFTDQNIWICTKNGVYKNGIKLKEAYSHYYAGKFISKVFKDKDANYWISTTNEGILFIPSLNNRFYKFDNFTPQQLQEVGNVIYMAGKDNSILEFDPAKETKKMVFQNSRNHEVSCFYYDSTNQKLLMSSDMFYQLTKGIKESEVNMAVKSVCKIDNKYYSVAASGICALYRFNNTTTSIWDQLFDANTVVTINNQSYSKLIIRVRGKSTAYDSKHKFIYYATNGGLFKVSTTEVNEVFNNGRTIQARKVLYYMDHLLVLQNNGIILTVNEQGDIHEYPFFINGGIIAVNKMILRKNWLFICTNGEGVFRLDMNNPTKTLKYINEVNKNEDVADIEVWQDKYLIACSGGLLILEMNENKPSKRSPKLILNEFTVNGEIIKTDQEMWFPYYKNNVHISYSILSYNTNFGYQLYYRINGGEWKLIDAENRELELASLKSDKYVIDFMLGNKIGSPIQTIKFTIGKPIWQVHWFWIGILILVLIIVFSIYKWQVNNLSKRNKLLLEKIELEKNLNTSILTSIKAQMNPHFFYNALNTIQSFIFSDDKKNASTYLSKFSKLTRLILEMSEKEVVSIDEEIQALQLYLDIEKVRFNNKLEFDIIVAKELDVEMVRIPSMIIQPYVENAIKHGLLHKKEDCKLSIHFKIEENKLKIIIDDNGIGRTKSAQLNAIKENKHQSFATTANQKRLEILNSGNKELAVQFIDKQNEIGNSNGTTVIITLPLKRSYE